MKSEFTVALCGNPNCGKTTIFNALTGTRQHVGNYPGVTVESKSGTFTLGQTKINLIDLPGVYSLSSSSPEEKVVFDELTTTAIDLIINVADATVPLRSLYLSAQLSELHFPMILALNMSDEAAERGLSYDLKELETYLAAPTVLMTASRRGGVQPLLDALQAFLPILDKHAVPKLDYGTVIEEQITLLSAEIQRVIPQELAHIPLRFFALKLLEKDQSVREIAAFEPIFPCVEQALSVIRGKKISNTDTFIADRRYAMLSAACRKAVRMSEARRAEISDKIDSVMTHKFFGLPIFLLIIYFMFYFTFTCAEPLMGYIEAGVNVFNTFVKNLWPVTAVPVLRALVTDGIIAGVGGVLVFLPNILFLFFAIALLEDSGYMARAAYVMDGIMRKFGLQGRAFVPLILGFGCNVPAIMATRCMSSDRDRRTTIMILPLMSCGARLPIYTLIIPAFFASKYDAFILWTIYLLGVIIALLAAGCLKKTLFKGDGEVCLMELPPYRMPGLNSMLLHMWDRGKMYLHKAGTVILLASIILFICNTYPEKKVFATDYDAQITALAAVEMPDSARADRENALRNEQAAEAMEYTISGRVGHALAPMMAPIGFDWKLTTASIGALAAKEVFVSQLGIVCALGQVDEESDSLRSILRANYTPLQGFCIMIFALLSIPCVATLAVIKREMNGWKWAFIEGAGLFALAYILTFIIYQFGLLFNIGTAIIK